MELPNLWNRWTYSSEILAAKLQKVRQVTAYRSLLSETTVVLDHFSQGALGAQGAMGNRRRVC